MDAWLENSAKDDVEAATESHPIEVVSWNQALGWQNLAVASRIYLPLMLTPVLGPYAEGTSSLG